VEAARRRLPESGRGRAASSRDHRSSSAVMSRSFCPGKLGGVEFTYRDVLSHFGVRKFQVTRFTPPAENQRNPTCRADCRAGAAAAGWGAGRSGVLVPRRRGDGGRQAAARDPARLCLACAWSPSATYRARHRLGSRSEDPPRDLRARSVGGMSVLHFGGLQCWALIMFRSSCGLVRGIAHSNPFSPLGSRLGVGRGGLHSQ
jgi:hypothetical protein